MGGQSGGSPEAKALVQEVAALPAVHRAVTWASRQAEHFASEAARLAEIPAPTFAEGARADYTAERFQQLGLHQVEQDATGNVYALMPGAGSGQSAIALVAHLDTVFGSDVPHTVVRRERRLYAPGIGDNAAGLAGVLGAVEALQLAGVTPERPIWLVASVGEEGLGNLRGAIAATDRLGGEVDAMIAVEGSFFGRLSYEGVGSRRLAITCHAPGGHSWHDYGRPSAVHVLARAAAAVAGLTPPQEPRTTLNIGTFQGGTGVNVIAEQARMVVDMRSVDSAALETLSSDVQALVAGFGGGQVRVDIDEVGRRPAGGLSAQHPLVQICQAILKSMHVSPQCAPASTDANIPLSRGIPAVTLGITRGGGAHTRGEWIDTEPMARGVQQLVLAMLALSDRRAGLTRA